MVKRFTVVREEDPFKEIIDRQSIAHNQREKKVRSSLYASDYGQCQRKIWFQFYPVLFPVEQEVDAQTARVFANGNDVHERLGKYLRAEESLKFKDEVNVPRDDLDVHGRCDGITTYNGRFHVVEFKSINARSVNEEKSEHHGQLTWYLLMFEKMRNELREEFECGQYYPSEEELKQKESKKGRTWDQLDEVEQRLLLSQGVVEGRIIYESKHGQAIDIFKVPFDEDAAEKVRLWFETMKRYVDEQRKPEVFYDKDAYPCSWGTGKNVRRCAYYEYCHGVAVPEVDEEDIPVTAEEDPG